jgi:hypothetical protein
MAITFPPALWKNSALWAPTKNKTRKIGGTVSETLDDNALSSDAGGDSDLLAPGLVIQNLANTKEDTET